MPYKQFLTVRVIGGVLLAVIAVFIVVTGLFLFMFYRIFVAAPRELAHAAASDRTQRHRRMLSFLKEGGTFILEAFSKEQIQNQTGGPKNIDMLFSEEELMLDFQELTNLKIWKEEIDLQEGPFHSGKANVIRLTGMK